MRLLIILSIFFCSLAHADDTLNWSTDEVLVAPMVREAARPMNPKDYEREQGQTLRHQEGDMIVWRDVYTTPDGRSGYTDHFERVKNGKTQLKSVHVGPENRKSEDWKDA